MFYQEYRQNESLEPAVRTMQPNIAYYLDNPIEGDNVQVTGDNGSYMLTNGQQIIYNPLINAKIDSGILVHPIPNLLDGKIVSKIQAEFSEKNTNSLSNNAIFINADMIRGYKKTNETETNIYSFETIDDVATKIRYLGIIPCNMQDNDFIILNYYTTD
jgi:hypothetical protein